MISPVLRCNHRSGSSSHERTVSTVKTMSATASITGNERASCEIDRLPEVSDWGRAGTESISRSIPAMAFIGLGYFQLVRSNQAVHVGAGDTQFSGGVGFLSIAIGDGLSRPPVLIAEKLR